MMTVTTIPVLHDNYTYLVASGGEAAVIDPAECAPVLQAIRREGVTLTAILLTHHHADHTSGVRELKGATGAIVAATPGGSSLVERELADGDELNIGGTTVTVIATPGHTPHDVTYFAPSLPAAWTGDTLFVGGCGRPMGSAAPVLWQSLLRLRELPPDTLIYCGHDYTVENLEFAQHLEPDYGPVRDALQRARERGRNQQATVPSRLADELQYNPFLRCDQPAFQAAVGMPGQPAAGKSGSRRKK